MPNPIKGTLYQRNQDREGDLTDVSLTGAAFAVPLSMFALFIDGRDCRVSAWIGPGVDGRNALAIAEQLELYASNLRKMALPVKLRGLN